jgi:hypothetical protein
VVPGSRVLCPVSQGTARLQLAWYDQHELSALGEGIGMLRSSKLRCRLMSLFALAPLVGTADALADDRGCWVRSYGSHCGHVCSPDRPIVWPNGRQVCGAFVAHGMRQRFVTGRIYRTGFDLAIGCMLPRAYCPPRSNCVRFQEFYCKCNRPRGGYYPCD